MTRKKIVIGLDFDGVVAYNPFRLARAPIKWFKTQILGKKKVSFVVPKSRIARLAWTLIHESSIFPANGIELLKKMSRSDRFEFHLITARFGYLESSLMTWLERNNLTSVFKSISVNVDELQPHDYKLQKINSLNLNYFVEDNLDIVKHVDHKTNAKIFWIYNLVDRNAKFENKFSCLRNALDTIKNENTGIN